MMIFFTPQWCTAILQE